MGIFVFSSDGFSIMMHAFFEVALVPWLIWAGEIVLIIAGAAAFGGLFGGWLASKIGSGEHGLERASRLFAVCLLLMFMGKGWWLELLARWEESWRKELSPATTRGVSGISIDASVDVIASMGFEEWLRICLV